MGATKLEFTALRELEIANDTDVSPGLELELQPFLKPFKVRCSGIGDIMGIKGLGKTGETFCKNWLKEQIYDRRKDFSNKYTDKGERMEQQAIDMVAEYLGWSHNEKNSEWFEDEHLTGTPDVILDDIDTIADIKNSWDCFTFPLLDEAIPTSDYEYQLQGYMALTGKKKALLVYVLMDAPEDVVQAECRRISWKEGYRGLIEDHIYKKVKEEMTYSNLPMDLRVKTFEVERNEETIKKIRERVLACREVLTTIKYK